MSTKFFIKKIGRSLSALFVCILLVLGLYLSEQKPIGQKKTFYFLVSTEMNVEVGVEFSKFDGGAGYLLEYGGQEYVAWSVYEQEEDGKNIQKSLEEIGKNTLLIQVGGELLYKNDVHSVKGMGLLESYISFLNQCISRLEKGMTQESCKRTLKILEKQLKYAQEMDNVSKECSVIFRQAEKSLMELTKKQVYAKDLRYVLCQFVDCYVQLSVGKK